MISAAVATAVLLSPLPAASAQDGDPNLRPDLSTRILYEIEGSKFGQPTLFYFGGMAITPLSLVKILGGAAILALVIAGIVEGAKATSAT